MTSAEAHRFINVVSGLFLAFWLFLLAVSIRDGAAITTWVAVAFVVFHIGWAVKGHVDIWRIDQKCQHTLDHIGEPTR